MTCTEHCLNIGCNNRVKGISYCLTSETSRGSDGRSAVVNGNLIGITLVHELVANEVGDDSWVQSRAVDEIVTDGSKGVFLAAIENAEGNFRNTTVVEVSDINSRSAAYSST